MPKKHTRAPINPAMHYAVFIALFVSLITTFLLGMLLTETTFKPGLNYFSYAAEQAKVHKADARQAARFDGAVVGVDNNFLQKWSSGGETYYKFRVNVNNAGDEHIKRMVISYEYDRAVFEYVLPGQAISLAPEEKAVWSWLKPKKAQAQVSIDFPIPQETFYRCALNTETDPALCDLIRNGSLLKSGDLWPVDFIFRLREPLAAKPSMLDRFLSWFLGTAKAQVSIDFPISSNYSSTVVRVVEAVTVNGHTELMGILEAVGTATLY